MRTFTGTYSNGNYTFSSDSEAIKAQLISILNTPLGSRFYYPSYGSTLNTYNFSVLNYFTINIIGQEVKRVIDLIDGVTLSAINYTIVGNTLQFNIELVRMSQNIKIRLSVTDGVAS